MFIELQVVDRDFSILVNTEAIICVSPTPGEGESGCTLTLADISQTRVKEDYQTILGKLIDLGEYK